MTDSAMTPRELAAAFRKRAQELLGLAEQVEREAPLLTQTPSANGVAPQSRARRGLEKKKSRREMELIKFLHKVGPCGYKKMKDESGIPTGTLVTLLRRSSFKKDVNDLWTVTEN